MRRRSLTLFVCAYIASFTPGAAQDTRIEFFEKNVRPVLAANCYSCHSSKSKSPFAGLTLDTKAGVTRGSDQGPVIVAGDPAASRLIKAIKGELPQRMPPGGSLKAEQIAAIEQWIAAGAAWPAESSVPASAPASAFNLDARRKSHWAWQPVRAVTPPGVKNESWILQPPDRFVLARLESKGLKPASPATREMFIRRATLDLTGLPPTPAEVIAFRDDAKPGAYERLIDRLLESPRYGERVARRWMDLVRFAESHGSEGDPDILEAWRYRDYLVRAFNADVPYDQLVREHLAGDLLPNPRINAKEHLNESILGTAHLRMVEHGFQPVDPWEDRVKWTDNQVDVFSKAFQGLTISCARCHDHKFDAISQKDYYAVFGTLAGARPVQVAIDAPQTLARNRDELAALKTKIRQTVGAEWLQQSGDTQIEGRAGKTLPEGYRLAWDLRRPGDYNQWLRTGTGAPANTAAPGEFWIEPTGDRAIGAVYPSGVYSHLLSNKHSAIIQSPRFKVTSKYISLRALGGKLSTAQLILENYSVPRGGIYGQRWSPKKDEMDWVTWDVTYWQGFSAYIEFAGARDVTLFQLDPEDGRKKPRPEIDPEGRSWFGAQQVVFHDSKERPPAEAVEGGSLRAAVEAWRDNRATDAQAWQINQALQQGKLSASPKPAADLIAEYRRLEAEVPTAHRGPGVLEEAPAPQRLLVRGNHKNLGEPVPQRYITALASKTFPDAHLARLRLAEEVTDPKNPLTARVMANRIWQWMFRRGVVRTVDNFGKLGEPPADPELLDWLAQRFINEGWSIKKMVRMLALSQAYRMSSAAPAEAKQADPANAMTHHVSLRRLEAEELRDSVLTIAGDLDAKMYGPAIPVYYAHDTGKTKGDRPKGPLDGAGRRSVYLEIRRNATNPFLEAFDVPKPSITRGERDVTNVPAQSLALLNSPFLIEQCERWAKSLTADGATQLNDRIARVWFRALGRAPETWEIETSAQLIADLAREHAVAPESVMDSVPVWRDYTHSLFNLKEFLYVR